MVGYDANANFEVNGSRFAVAGAASGFLTRLFVQPFDVLKIRFQLQIEPLKANSVHSKYSGVSQATKKIVEEEGFLALWKGQIPAQFLSIIYGIVQFSSFEYFTALFWTHTNGAKYRNTVNWICGSLSGASATMAIQPFDVIRTRLIAQSHPKTYVSVTHAFCSIMKSEGVYGLYRGLLPSLYQIVPYSGTTFCVNGYFNHLWLVVGLPGSKDQPTTVQSFVCGGVAGVMGKVVIYPLDLAKKRLQVQGFNHARRSFGKTIDYTGLLDCLVKVVKMESFFGLYKGLYPSLLKAGTSSALNFAVYEQILNLFKRKMNSNKVE